MNANIRNVAIIAHVDHGKTTLVDALIRQSDTVLNKEDAGTDLIMDSNELEKERGITIFSKNASIRRGDLKINIIDTPGHADFGGEVERVLSMADGCLLLVDAKEGPMPQTRFVLKHALRSGLKVIVVINKIDKPDARIPFVHDATLELFMELGATDEQIDFPVVYASAKQGKAGNKPELSEMTDINPIYEAIIKHISPPACDVTKPLQMRVTTLGADSFKGRIATGRIEAGTLAMGQEIMHINREGAMKKCRIMALMGFDGLNRMEIKQAEAGDIVAVAGIADALIGETIADITNPVALALLPIEEPTVRMTFMVNDSPFAGKEGQYSTSRQIRDRLFKELETDMALRVADTEDGKWTVSGRGELHLSILIERMRREGFEFQVARPQVIAKVIDGVTNVPFENVYIEVPEEFSGAVIQKLGSRYGELREMKTDDKGITSLEFVIPTRGLFGYRTQFLTDTRGLGIMNTNFHGYKADPGKWQARDNGSLVAFEDGVTTLYALVNIQERGVLFFGQAVKVYKGQVIGENARGDDMRVNVCKEKQLSNMRSKGDGEREHFNTPRVMTLEDAIEYIGDDELVEITPESIRIRKMILDENQAKKAAKGMK